MSIPEFVGKAFVNIHDGRRAVLVEVPTGIALAWKDRAEQRVDPITMSRLNADWKLENDHPRSLRDEDIARVAHAADQMLEGLEKNEPLRFWQIGNVDRRVYDGGLVQVVVDYLRDRR